METKSQEVELKTIILAELSEKSSDKARSNAGW